MSKQKILLHSNHFSERAESSQFIDLAQILDQKWNVESVIAFPKSNSINSPRRILEAERLGVNLLSYSRPADLRAVVASEAFDLSLVMSDGSLGGPEYCRDNPEDFRLSESVHAIHVVFRNYNPHGDYYLYVSDWLLKWAHSNKPGWGQRQTSKEVVVSSLPHGLGAPGIPHRDFRQELSIPKDAFVMARIGGFDTFNDGAAADAVVQSLQTNPGLYFVAANTRHFAVHPRLVYVDLVDRTDISSFYSSFDLFLNGRKDGETFGFSIVEPMAHGKPVLAPHWKVNQKMNRNGTLLLKGLGLLYRNQRDLEAKTKAFIDGRRISPERLKHRVKAFSVDDMALGVLSLIGGDQFARVRQDIVKRGFWAQSELPSTD